MENVMTARQLPPHPNLDQLKHQAKELLRGLRARTPGSLARLRVLPAFTGATDDALARVPVALHDAQSVIAREHGFASWNDLREAVEERTLAFDGALEQFLEAALGGRPDRAERLLALHPGIAQANLQTALVLGDAAGVEARLARDASLATRPGGRPGWEPLHYVCHTSLAHGAAARGEGLSAIARRLLELGADPNLRYPWLHHGVHRSVLWGAVRVVRHLPLAECLLQAGADPDDGVTLPLSASHGDLPALELLRAHGADVNQPWASDGAPTLYAILQWSPTLEGGFWLLEHGAHPNAAFAENGETPLHAAARLGALPLARALVERGADVGARRRDGRTPYALAVLHGNGELAEWLGARGTPETLAPVDRLTAACSSGDRATAQALLAEHPGLSSQLGTEHDAALHRAAERNDIRALELMLACGFDPNRPDDSIGKTALHSAAMAGWPEAVRVLLAHGASVHARDREFHGPPLVWAAEGSRSSPPGRDHAQVGRLLLQAGSPVEWEPGAEPSEAVREILAEWARAR
jgi:ankyrin repeat protein